MDLSNNSDTICLSKWNYLKTFFKETLHSAEGNSNITFQCLLCIPKIKLISTSITSNSNLRSHIKVSIDINIILLFNN